MGGRLCCRVRRCWAMRIGDVLFTPDVPRQLFEQGFRSWRSAVSKPSVHQLYAQH